MIGSNAYSNLGQAANYIPCFKSAASSKYKGAVAVTISLRRYLNHFVSCLSAYFVSGRLLCILHFRLLTITLMHTYTQIDHTYILTVYRITRSFKLTV